MIFNRLTLSNFRVFDGNHSVDLQPRREGLFTSPVVLFGGLNGAGKTTILTAIRLILLGRRAVGKVQTNLQYKEYLAEQINKKALASQSECEATLTLEFTHTHDGQHNSYIVTRKWSMGGDECLTIEQNGLALDELNSDQVQTILSEIVPPGIGDLFFFDGEKIAELAEDETGEYLKEAVQKLLGIDVVNRLSHDLDIYLKQLSKDVADKSLLQKIAEYEKEKTEYYSKAKSSRNKADEIAPELMELKTKIAKIEATIQERGGAWANTRETEKAKLEEIVKDKEIIEREILRELDGAFPLSLAPKTIESLLQQLTKDKENRENSIALSKMTEYSKLISSELSDLFDVDNDAVSNAISNALKQPSAEGQATEMMFDISDSDYYSINSLVSEAKNSQETVSKLASSLTNANAELESLSMNIQRAPDAEEISTLYEKLRDLDKQKVALKSRYVDHLKDAKLNMVKAVELAKRLEKLFNQQKNESTITKADSRINNTKQLLASFSNELTQLRVRQLEELFAISYRKLARKEDLKLSARIDPDSFDVALVDKDGVAINRKSLSAGEKQIFAFAILEALGKLSGKVLPVVIDTPLGRLDSKHRDKLVNNYFPEAGEQVILLSTDTEVDEEFYEALSSNLSHAYRIHFDEKTRCSNITEGYFWQERHKEAV